MALDGTVIAALVSELSEVLTGQRVSKIAMPEKDELLLTIKKTSGGNERLLISAGASLPLMYLTDEQLPSPASAPAFCMLLRKHIGSARIVSIEQAGLERIIVITFEHYNEMGDICRKKLVTELMGKYSNIIFTDDKDLIIDSIRHIPASVSSLREVLPGRNYYLPDELKKLSFLIETEDGFFKTLGTSPQSVCSTLVKLYEGISPVMANELCERAQVDGDRPFGTEGKRSEVCLTQEKRCALIKEIFRLREDITACRFEPQMILKNDKPQEFSAVDLISFRDGASGYVKFKYDSISRLLKDFYSAKNSSARIKQKSSDLRRIVTTALERTLRKLEIQEKQLKDCESKDRFKVYGDLISTYGYALTGGEKVLICENYYDDNREISIPLDDNKSCSENAKRYYDKYSKLRRTQAAVGEEILRTRQSAEHLQSILTSLDIALSGTDLSQIRQELADFGYVKKATAKSNSKSGMKSSGKAAFQFAHYISSDGYDIYAGMNNYQNEELTFRFASGNDWWFHAKGIPGSHVIVKAPADSPYTGSEEIPDRVFEEAAAVAAYYSGGRGSDRVEIDYVQKKHVKRVTGAAPGFVIYHTNFSMLVSPKLPGKEIQVERHN